MNNQSTKVVTGPNTRWSFVHVFKPYDPNGNEANAKYSLCLIIPKDDEQTINAIKEAIKLAYKEGESRLKGNNGKLPTLESLRIVGAMVEHQLHFMPITPMETRASHVL